MGETGSEVVGDVEGGWVNQGRTTGKVYSKFHRKYLCKIFAGGEIHACQQQVHLFRTDNFVGSAAKWFEF